MVENDFFFFIFYFFHVQRNKVERLLREWHPGVKIQFRSISPARLPCPEIEFPAGSVSTGFVHQHQFPEHFCSVFSSDREVSGFGELSHSLIVFRKQIKPGTDVREICHRGEFLKVENALRVSPKTTYIASKLPHTLCIFYCVCNIHDYF